MVSGSTKSCGCLSAEIASQIRPNDYKITEDHVTVFLNNDYQFIIDKETYFNKISNQHCYYDAFNKRILCSHDINIYHILFPFLNRRRSFQYIVHENNDMFDFRKENLKIVFPDNFNYDDFFYYVSENIAGISIAKRESKWLVCKGIVDDKQHSFEHYVDAKKFILQSKQEVLINGN